MKDKDVSIYDIVDHIKGSFEEYYDINDFVQMYTKFYLFSGNEDFAIIAHELVKVAVESKQYYLEDVNK